MRLLLAIFVPFFAFFTIGRPIAAIVCLLLQISLIGWLPAAFWAVYALSQYTTDKKIESALNVDKCQTITTTNLPTSPLASPITKKIRVWDPLVRILHWTLVFCVVSNLLNESGHFAHRTLGIIAACVVAVRIVWGFVGPQYARFSDWFPTPQKLVPYIKALLRNEAPRHVGHNPAGAVMMLILMVTIIGLGTSGFLMTTDAFYENDTLKELHESLVGVLLTCVVVHVAAALFESWKHREDLIGAMFHGKKRPPEAIQDEANKAE